MSIPKIYTHRKIRLELTVTVNGATVTEYYGGGRLYCFLPHKLGGRIVERKYVRHTESEGRILISLPEGELGKGIWGVELVWTERPPVTEIEDRMRVVRYPDSPLLGQCNCKVLARACKTDIFQVVTDADQQTVSPDGTVVIRQSLSVTENPPKIYRDYCIATGYTGTYEEFLWLLLESGGGSSITVDSAMSSTSTNPVQNKVIKGVVDTKQDVLDWLTLSDVRDIINEAMNTI